MNSSHGSRMKNQQFTSPNTTVHTVHGCQCNFCGHLGANKQFKHWHTLASNWNRGSPFGATSLLSKHIISPQSLKFR